MTGHNENNPFLKDSDFFKSTQLQDNGLLIKSKSEPSLEEFKRALISILQGQLKKSISDDFIDLNEELLIKGINYPVGTVREWQGKKFKKIRQGKWMRVYSGEESRGEKQAITNTIKKIQAATSIEELAKIVNDNRKRFLNPEGKSSPVVKRLLDIAKHRKGFGRGSIAKDRKKSDAKKEEVNKEKPEQKEKKPEKEKDPSYIAAKKRADWLNESKKEDQERDDKIKEKISKYSKEELQEKLDGLSSRKGPSKIYDKKGQGYNVPEGMSNEEAFVLLEMKQSGEIGKKQSTDQSGKSFPKELDQFVDIINSSKTEKEAFSEVLKNKNVPSHVADKFRELYPHPTAQEAFSHFYKDVKGNQSENKK